MSFDYPTAPIGVHCVYDINEPNNDVEDEDKCFSAIGWGDLLIFNLLLLMVIPSNSSLTIKICIAFGCIVSIEFAEICNGFILYCIDFNGLPALPLPTAAVTAYMIIVNAIIEYSNVDCINSLKCRTNIHYEF
ncbi:unnamed protein product [Rotaria sp. Silwood2]|nr:unnamed protein product [Rotaria sp. Silwood2]CAF3162971.1 unnamed protein product [Rotaria sp. Silwood2]CAF3284886.1 unnamed protein product [Rotaria sp. Silwood2]CAF4184462.1 unnamed protein product [Rotaria sp. Silwood2]CAF4507949.1 unnamed protein product [Rotaria sp. Silwood2]